MIDRTLNLLESNSFFLFGARGTGKSTYLNEKFQHTNTLWIDLLSAQTELQFADNPDRLSELIAKQRPEWVVIDEVQKLPKILDVVHKEIENTDHDVKFALTGSSARKLKRGGANLLAGRAFVYNLFPFTHHELGEDFDLEQTLQWGNLPGLYKFSHEQEKKLFLENYVETYLKEEIFQEQLTRKIIPFRKFLKLAAQSNGTILNYNKIADDISIDSNTVKNYFDILEDTLLGFYLPAQEKSFRKQQIKSPKFYLFDCGVKREIEGVSHYPISSSQERGPIFEHWIMTEIFRLNSYNRYGYNMTYLQTKAGTEVDLILTKPREKTIFVEIKSTNIVQDRHLEPLKAFQKDYPDNRFICVCNEQQPRVHHNIDILPWRSFFDEIGLGR